MLLFCVFNVISTCSSSSIFWRRRHGNVLWLCHLDTWCSAVCDDTVNVNVNKTHSHISGEKAVLLYCEINCFHRSVILCTRTCAQLQINRNFSVVVYRHAHTCTLRIWLWDTITFVECTDTLYTLHLSSVSWHGMTSCIVTWLVGTVLPAVKQLTCLQSRTL